MCIKYPKKVIKVPDIHDPRPGEYFYMPAIYLGPTYKQVRIVARSRYWASGESAVTFRFVDCEPTADLTVQVDYFEKVARLAPKAKKHRELSLDEILAKRPCIAGMRKAVNYWADLKLDSSNRTDLYKAYQAGAMDASDVCWLANHFNWHADLDDGGEKFILSLLEYEE